MKRVEGSYTDARKLRRVLQGFTRVDVFGPYLKDSETTDKTNAALSGRQ